MRPDVSSRSLPAVRASRQHQQSHSDEGSTYTCTTQPRDAVPYRLPKLSLSNRLAHSAPSGESAVIKRSNQDQLYKFDYVGSDKIEKYLHKKKKLPAPPHTIAQLQRQEGIHMPTFQRVNIEPVLPSSKVDECMEDTALGPSTRRTSCSTRDTIVLTSGLSQQTTNKQLGDGPKTDKQAAWRLSPHQHQNYDVQAIRGPTGPFSRDFIIHCNTPNSWLNRMKRRKTTP